MGRKKGMSIQQLAQAWKELIVGQDHAIDKITPYLIRAQAGLNAPNRPIGIFFLMGPTGTGKTKTAETLAELLHGSDKNIIRVDCGEFQMEHEVAKIIGAPPGYLGHRETQPIFTQAKVNALASDKSKFSVILFDEIEKAHPGVWRAILGILDKATLRLGDNSQVNFENCVIFLSSNVGAKEISNLLEPHFGFDVTTVQTEVTEAQQKAIEKIGLGSMSKKFPPEFENRVDEIIMYHNLTHDTLAKITDMELRKIQAHIFSKLGAQAFTFTYDHDTLNFLTDAGTSIKYGARELKRTLGRYILNPLADDFVDGKISPNSIVTCKVETDHVAWDITEAANNTPCEPIELEAAASATGEGSVVKKRTRAKSSG
jgi:ATP-dependent Clp protease ATP-binding subunit ClpA